MSDNLMIILFAVTFGAALLGIVQFQLAYWHDRVVSLAGPLEEESAINVRIKERREQFLELDEELKNRRKAIENLAKISADVEEMERRLSELEAEWSQQDDRRAQVHQIRLEVEKSITEKLAIDSQLSTKRSELEAIIDRIDKAKKLISRSERIEKDIAQLEERRDALQGEVKKLQEAESEINRLRDEKSSLQTSIAHLQGTVNEKEERLNYNNSELQELRHRLSELVEERNSLAVELTNGRTEAERLEIEIVEKASRLAVLERKIEQKENHTGHDDPNGDDPLEELKSEPFALTVMNNWEPATKIDESEALKNVKNRFSSFGLSYHSRTLRAFHTAMKVNETSQMAILAGISGTGKSQLPRQYALGMGIGFLKLPVQPRWDSPQDLMGFYNYIEGRFRPTDMARSLYALDTLNNEEEAVHDRMMLILLDEMNLARVEYYFSDFLSRLEARPSPDEIENQDLRKDAELEIDIHNLGQSLRIFPGYNVLFAGTMNEDASTQSLSEKVIDRANFIRFAAPKNLSLSGNGHEPANPKILSHSNWEKWCKPNLDDENRSRVENKIGEMSDLMKAFGKPFGHRLAQAIENYVALYPFAEEGSDRVNNALSDQVEMRLLPKLIGVNTEDKRNEFGQLRKFVEDLGDDSLSEAIQESVEQSRITELFLWRGCTR